MEQIQDPKSVEFAPIWLKTVSSASYWPGFIIPWLKAWIRSEGELNKLMQIWGLYPPFSLLHTCESIWQLFDGWFSSLSEVSLRFAVPVQLDSVHHQIRLSSSSDQAWLDSLSASVSLSVMHAPLWARVSVFAINKPQFPPFQAT